MFPRFTRTKEDFICENCGREVEGNGYTNHCSFCLCSKHVDISPGDREEGCGGMMRPVSIEVKRGVPARVVHQCLLCGFKRPAPIVKNDNLEEVQRLAE